MKQIEQQYLCNTCMGCNRLEIEEIKGIYRCENYARGAKDNGNNRNTIQITKSK